MTTEHLADEPLRPGLLLDEHSLAAALDRESPGLLALALAFAGDRETADHLVESAWTCALLAGQLADLGAGLRLALVRQMGAGPGHGEADPRLAAARRELRAALDAAARPVLPRPRAAGERRPPAAAPGTAHLRGLPPALRLVLVLRDVAGWPAVEVQALIGVHGAAQRAMLGQARRALLDSLRT